MEKNKSVISLGLVLAIVLGVVVVGGGAYYLGKNNENVNIEKTPDNILPTLNEEQDLSTVNKNDKVISPNSSITVLSPNGGEVYNNNDKITVKWKGIWKDKIAIYLRFSDGDWCFVKDVSSSTNNYVFTPYGHNCTNKKIITNGQYKITIISYENSGMAPEPGTAFATSYSDGNDGYFDIDSSDNYFTINSSSTSATDNLIKLTSCGVSFSKTSDWNVISNSNNEIKLDLPNDTHTGFAGISIKCVLDNKITDTDAKFGSITYFYDTDKKAWMETDNREGEGITPHPTPVLAIPVFKVGEFSVFRGTGRWLTYIIPISPTSVLYFNEGDTEGGNTQTLTNLVKTIKKL